MHSAAAVRRVHSCSDCPAVCVATTDAALIVQTGEVCAFKREPSIRYDTIKIGKGSPYSITERRVPELIPVLGSQPAGDVSYKPGGRLPLLSARPAVTPATIKRAATNFAAW